MQPSGPSSTLARSKGAMNVAIKLQNLSASGLVGLDIGDTSDPFLVISLCGEGMAPVKRKTSVIGRTNHAAWPETFDFQLSAFSAGALSALRVEFECWDRNVMTADQLIGTASVTLYELATGPRSFTVGLSLPSSFPGMVSVSSALPLRGVLSFEAVVSQTADAVALVKDVAVELQLEGSESGVARLLAALEPFSPVSRPTDVPSLGFDASFPDLASPPLPLSPKPCEQESSGFHSVSSFYAPQSGITRVSGCEKGPSGSNPTQSGSLLALPRDRTRTGIQEIARSPPRLSLEASFTLDFSVPGNPVELSPQPPVPAEALREQSPSDGCHAAERESAPCLLEYKLIPSATDVRTGPNAVTLPDLYGSAVTLRLLRADTLAPIAEAFVPVSLLPLRNTSSSNPGLEVGVSSGKRGPPSGVSSARDDCMHFVAPLFLLPAQDDHLPSSADQFRVRKRGQSQQKSKISGTGTNSHDTYSDDGEDDDDDDADHNLSGDPSGGPIRRTIGVIRGKICLEQAPIITQLVHGRWEQPRGCVDALLLCDTLPFPPKRVWNYCGASSPSPTQALTSTPVAIPAGASTSKPSPTVSSLPSNTSAAASIAAVVMPAAIGLPPSSAQKPMVLYAAGKGVAFKGFAGTSIVSIGAGGSGPAVATVNPASSALRVLSGRRSSASGSIVGPSGLAFASAEPPWEWSMTTATFP